MKVGEGVEVVKFQYIICNRFNITSTTLYTAVSGFNTLYVIGSKYMIY